MNPIKALRNEWQQAGNNRQLLDAMTESTPEQRAQKQRVLEATRRRSWGEPTDVPLAVEARTAIKVELIELDGNDDFLTASFSTDEAKQRFAEESVSFLTEILHSESSCSGNINPCYDGREIARYLGRFGEAVYYGSDGGHHPLD